MGKTKSKSKKSKKSVSIKKLKKPPVSKSKKMPAKAVKPVITKEAKVLEKKVEKKVLELSPEAKSRIIKTLSNPFARQIIVDLAGENALEIVRTFSVSTSDEEIAKRLKLKISDVRATLNRLHSEGLVSYLREKDGETGWYSYTWMLNEDRVQQWFSNQLEQARFKVDSANPELYFCIACGPTHIHDFVSACECQFKCPNCSKNLDFLDEQKRTELFNVKMK